MKWTTTLVLTAIALLLAAWIIFVELPRDRGVGVVEAAEKALFVPQPADIVRLEITPRDRPKRVMVKEEDEWRLVEPIEAAATKWTINSDCDRLEGLEYLRSYHADDPARPSDTVTGLSNPLFEVHFADSKGQEFGLKIGNRQPIGEGTYVQRTDQEVIYLVKADLAKTFDRRLDEYRDKTVVKMEALDAVGLSLAGVHNYTLHKDEDKWIIQEPLRARADKNKLQDVVNALARLYVTAFVPTQATNLAAYGLDPPRLTITFTTEKEVVEEPAEQTTTEPAEPTTKTETRSVTLLIGSKAGNNYYAKLADQPSIFELSTGTYNRLAKPLEDIRDPVVLPFEWDTVVKLIIDSITDGVTILARGEDGRWAIEGETVAAEGPSVQQTLRILADLRASGYEDPQSALLTDLGFDPPRCRVSLTREGQVEPLVLEVGNDTPSGTMTYVRNLNEGLVSVVPAESLAGLLTKPLEYFDRLIVEVDRPRVEEVRITRDRQSVRLEKHADTWTLIEPVVADAETAAVNELLADVTRLRAKGVLARAHRAAEFGLDNPSITAVFVAAAPLAAVEPATQPAQPTGEEEAIPPAETQPTTAPLVEAPPTTEPASAPAEPAPPAEPAVTQLLVSERGGQAFVMLPGGSLIYEIDSRIYEHLAAEFHRRKLLELTPKEVMLVRLASPGNAYEFRRTDEEWTLADDPYFPVDQGKVNDMVDALRDLRAQRFLVYDQAELSAYGLDQPDTVLTVRLEDGTKLQLNLADSDQPQTLHGTLVGSGKVFALSRQDLKPIDQPIDSFKKQS